MEESDERTRAVESMHFQFPSVLCHLTGSLKGIQSSKKKTSVLVHARMCNDVSGFSHSRDISGGVKF